MSALVLHFQAQPVEISTTFAEAKAQALNTAAMVGDLTNGLTQQVALNALAGVQRLIKDVEKTRTDVKSGPLELCRQIDQTAKAAVAELEIAQGTLKRKLSDFQRELDQRRAEEERRKAEELQRIEREKQDALAKAQAEAAKLAPAKAAQVVAAAEVAAVNHARAQTQELLAVEPTPVKPEGAVVSRPWKYEVEDIHALYRAHPELVDLTPKGRAILDVIRDGKREIPGLRIFQDVEVRTR